MRNLITDDVTLTDAIRYAQEIYDSTVINAYIESNTIMADEEQPPQLS